MFINDGPGMILPTMTLAEIRKEIERDYFILTRKMNYFDHDIKKKLGKALKKQDYIKSFDYYSKYKNHWIYTVFITKKKSNFSSLMLYHNGKGHAGIAITPDLLIVYHTGHFFERYNERGKLGLKTLEDIMRAYLLENNLIEYREVEDVAPGISKVFCIISSGIILGILNKQLRFIKANTFLTNDMLHKNQIEFKAQIKAELEKYKNTSGVLN
jgi:hypothetical protein